MATLQNFKIEDYERLLGSENVDIADAAAERRQGTMKVNKNNRTILIGMGGSGVKALNRIKHVLRTRMEPGWNRYVAFLAIDTDDNELKHAGELDPIEKLNTTKQGVNARFSDRNSFPAAAQQFMPDGHPDPNGAVPVGNLYSDGANRMRLVGKIKLHDKDAGSSMGNDEEIVHRLTQLTTSTYMEPMAVANGRYEVYVIGSGSGGTCSGGFIDMPALIRTALRVVAAGRLYVHGMLFLPDTLVGLDPANAQALQANGYATLKELNYYQGMVMRPGYPESFPYGGTPAQLEIQKHFDISYLVGTTAATAGSKDASRSARDAISEFILSLLTDITTTDPAGAFLTASFLANADSTAWDHQYDGNTQHRNKELPNHYHNFPRGYSAIGFARATAQEKLLRTYQVNIACERAALKTVTKEAREANAASAASMPSFRAADDYFSAAEAETLIREMLDPLINLMTEIYCGTFSLSMAAEGQLAEYGDAKDFAEENIQALRNVAFDAQTGSKAQTDMKAAIDAAYNAFRGNVIAFIKNYGPLAYVNLFNGLILPHASGENVVGIYQRLKYLAEGRLLDGTPYVVPTVAETSRRRQETQQVLDETPDSLANRIKNKLNGFLDNIKGEWETAINNWVIAQVHAKRAELAFGDSGFISSRLLSKAAMTADKLTAFGYLLNSLSDIYSKGGKTVSDFNEFQNARESDVDVNMAAMDNGAYKWLKEKAEDAIAAVQGRDIRDRIIDDFFGHDKVSGKANWDLWLEVPESVARLDGSTLVMQSDEVAIPARARFDELVTETLTAPLDISAQQLIQQMTANGASYAAVATELIQKLKAASTPRCNIEGNAKRHEFILYPASLNTGAEGAAIVAALTAAAGNGVGVYETADATGIMYYQQATDFAAYQLKSIADWERSYNIKLGEDMIFDSFLHAKSPDTKYVLKNGMYRYEQGMRWREYPDLVGRADFLLPGGMSGKCREGLMRDKVHAVVEEAKLLGVLFSEQSVDGKYIIYRVHCDNKNEWNFDISGCEIVNGKYPLGKALAQAVADQNGRRLDFEAGSMIRAVRLEHAGALSNAQVEEKDAWMYAERVLRDHVPMFREVVDTLEKYFRGWANDIVTHNKAVEASNRPGMMQYLLESGALYCKNDQWMLRQENGTEKLVANLSPVVLKITKDGAPIMIKNNMLGYYLFTKLDALLPGDKLRSACDAAMAYLEAYAADLSALQPKLEAGAAFSEQIRAERAFHMEKHCREYISIEEADTTAPSPLYVDWLASILKYDANKAKAVELFYSRVMTSDEMDTLFI